MAIERRAELIMALEAEKVASDQGDGGRSSGANAPKPRPRSERGTKGQGDSGGSSGPIGAKPAPRSHKNQGVGRGIGGGAPEKVVAEAEKGATAAPNGAPLSLQAKRGAGIKTGSDPTGSHNFAKLQAVSPTAKRATRRAAAV